MLAHDDKTRSNIPPVGMVQYDPHIDPQSSLFESDAERAKRWNDSIEFYQHKDK